VPGSVFGVALEADDERLVRTWVQMMRASLDV
jgi:hypothetical protein